MNYQAIIFDFDGVLFDSEQIHLQAYNKIFRTLGFSLSEEQYFKEYVGLSDNDVLKLALEKHNIEHHSSLIKELQEKKTQAYNAIIKGDHTLSAIAGAKNFILKYQKRIPNFAICSGAVREEIVTTLRQIEQGILLPYFKIIVSMDDIHSGKPSPEGYLLTAKHLALSPAECLVIEDTQRGADAAKTAGMDVIALAAPYSKYPLKNAVFSAKSYMDIDAWLEKNDL